MFSTDFIFRQQENLVDNQTCQTGFRPLCNKILLFLPPPRFSDLPTALWLASTQKIHCMPVASAAYLPRYSLHSIFQAYLLTPSLDCFFFMTANLFKGQTLCKLWNVIVIRPVCLYFYKYRQSSAYTVL